MQVPGLPQGVHLRAERAGAGALRPVDEFGDHIVGCKVMLPLRTKLWHDPLVQVWRMLARMAGLSCGKEVSNLMLHSGKRPDVVLFPHRFNILFDVRTVAGADSRYCCAAALNPGYGAVWGAAPVSWVAQPDPAARGHVYAHLPRGGRPPGRAGQRLARQDLHVRGRLA